ncbi:hypothetical protein BHE97_16590 [Aeromicrobium sp. PE09-221]|uniref:type II toxin-antitoxin system PemK/MazF family toxin n=1 Tax=Aeromicrobium sp. PE09-221 TaxID=1898043 RepID=UPI000B3E901F|nr:type II toxin-antitoxin system PemK/MazF family toxin [Aeromicrobium sp. PE09-221]OUZ07563.1 hypothetical protein BHE97_16590 [Aeromicrobium sp. PE09-221]
MAYARGQILHVQFEHIDEPKLMLVVSNNMRNQKLGSVLAVRLTTTRKPRLPSIVDLGDASESVHGHIVCDDIVEVYDDEVLTVRTSLSPTTMSRVDSALAAALALPPPGDVAP